MSIQEIYSLPFMQYALGAACLSGAVLGYLGLFIVLRRVVFLGAALPQLAALGVAGAIMVEMPAMGGAVAGAILGVMLLSFAPSKGRIPPDGTVGFAYASAAAVAILLLAASAEGESHVMQILSGDILGTSTDEIFWMAGIYGLVVLIHFASWKEFLLVSYDPEMAATLGYRVRFWDGLLFLTLGATVALAMRVSGAVVSFALLIGPAATALLLSRRFLFIIPVAVGVGGLSGATGLTLSFYYELPSGPMIAACAVAPVFPVALLAMFRK